MFVHQTSIQCNGFRFLKEGEKVTFEVAKTDKGLTAANVTDETGKPFNRPSMAPGGPREPREPRGDRERKPRGPRAPRNHGDEQ